MWSFSNDLTLLFYGDYLCFILDLRRTKNKHNSYFNSFLLDTSSFSFIIFKRLHHTISKLNIVAFLKVLPLGPLLKPLKGWQCTQIPYCVLFPYSWKTQTFFSFLANALSCFLYMLSVFFTLMLVGLLWFIGIMSKMHGRYVIEVLQILFFHMDLLEVAKACLF